MIRWDNELKTVNDVAYERLQTLILAGEIQPGERLDERHLADLVGVSRTPLREAIARLVNLGIVAQVPYKGKYVRQLTAAEVDDLYETRKVLEVYAAQRAARRVENAEDLKPLREVIEEGTKAYKGGNMADFESADRSFHRIIVELSGSESIRRTLEPLQLQIQFFRHLANLDLAIAEHTIGDRLDVLEAIRAGEPDRAGEAMGQHICVVQEEVARHFPE